MNVGPYDVTEVIDRLKAEPGDLRLIGGTADLEAAKGVTMTTPAAFVALATEVGQKRQGGSTVSIQAVDVQFHVLLVLRDYQASKRGAAKAATLAAHIAAVRSRLLGWTPAQFNPATPVDLVGGQLIDYDKATVWWQDTYSTRYWRRGP
jgi:hypothetical protein